MTVIAIIYWPEVQKLEVGVASLTIISSDPLSIVSVLCPHNREFLYWRT